MDSQDKLQSSEVRNELNNIVQSNKEILELLDKIEVQKKKKGGANVQKEKDFPTSSDRNEAAQEDQPQTFKQHGKETTDQQRGNPENPRTDAIPVDSPNPKITKTEGDHAVKDGKGQQKLRNLKVIQKQTSEFQDFPGFREKIPLSEKQLTFGKKLRACKTVIEQDNRICHQFDLPVINKGQIYTSNNPDRDTTSEPGRDKKTAKCDDTTDPGKLKVKTTTVSGKQPKETYVKKTEMESRKNPPKSILKKSASSTSQTVAIRQKTTVAVKPSSIQNTQSDMTVARRTPSGNSMVQFTPGNQTERNTNVQRNLSLLMQGFDARTDQGKILLMTQAHTMRTTLTALCPDKKEAFHACADFMDKMATADGDFEDPNFWMKMSRDMGGNQKKALSEYLKEMKSLFSDGFPMDENLKIICQGSFAFLKAIIEGSFMEKCEVLGQYLEDHPELLSDPTLMQFTVMKLWAELDVDRIQPNGKVKAITAGRRNQPAKTGTVHKESKVTYQKVERVVRAKERHTEKGIFQKEEAVEKKDERADLKEEERVKINEELWTEYANEEIKKAKVAREIHEKGMDTIFCLDVSTSMKGEPIKQAKTFVKGFVEGIQNTNLGGDIFEHVALVTFGSETKVQQHLTCDYFELLRKLERIQPGGPTPMFAGLTMTWAAILGAGTIFTSNGYEIRPRVYILSDGKMTPSSFIAGPDTCTSEETKTEQSKVIRQAVHLHKEYHLTVNGVPVGEFDLSVFEFLTQQTGGKIISSDDWRLESKTFQNYLIACRTGQSTHLRKLILDSHFFDEEDQAQIDEFLRTHKQEAQTSRTDHPSVTYENDKFLPLGTRVKRVTKRGGQSTQVLGTVTKHFSDGIGVTWDQAEERESLRVKIINNNDVEKVDEPRILKDELIAEGCRVKRGRDWTYSDQDGKPGNEGVVFMVLQNGTVLVRWDHDGSTGVYKFGLDGRFDLEIIQPNSKASGDPTITITDSVREKDGIDIDELNRKNKQNSDMDSNKFFKWTWVDAQGTQRTFTEDITATVEKSYKRNPRGTVLIMVDDKQFRIVFSRMEMLDLDSRQKFQVSRT